MINWNFIGNYEEFYSKLLDFFKFIMVKIYIDFVNVVYVILLKILIVNNRFYYVNFCVVRYEEIWCDIYI